MKRKTAHEQVQVLIEGLTNLGPRSLVDKVDEIWVRDYYGDYYVTRDNSQQRILAQQSDATLFRHCFALSQHFSNIVALKIVVANLSCNNTLNTMTVSMHLREPLLPAFL